MSDWEDSDNEKPKTAIKKPIKGKWEGEDEDDDGPASDWEASSDEEEEAKPASAPVAPAKKKGTLKAKLAEKEAAKAARANDADYDSDEVLDPREKARRDKERELNADLNNAAELLGSAALGGTSSKELDSLISFQPRTKEDFIQLSSLITEFIIKRHQNKPLYAAFVEHHVKELAMPLKDVEVRKAASGLTILANEKTKDAKDKAGGKKKSKPAKPVLGSSKVSSRVDTGIYDESLDDFGTNADDFM
ncbi:translation initiation factor eIF3 subunit [Mycena floridula]|nr:translation initiation factor eIF3 subunit [Mycena floridula]